MPEPTDTLRPVEPIWTADLFPGLGHELLTLLRSLAPDDFARPTVCPGWTVADVAAHLLDTALRRLSVERDRHTLPPPASPIASGTDLVRYLDGLNAAWVQAARRLSPRLLIAWMEHAEAGLAAHLAALDPRAAAVFPVSWAAEDESHVWFDVARELTERWHHQQQIRLAVGAPPLDEPRWSGPVLETFLRVLPHRYDAAVGPAAGRAVGLEVEGRQTYRFTVRGSGPADAWSLWHGAAGATRARVVLDEETAWRLLTKSLTPAAARARCQRVEGPDPLLVPFFEAIAVVALRS